METEKEWKWNREREGWETESEQVNDGGAITVRVLVSCSLGQ